MLKLGKYLSGKKCLYMFVAENKKTKNTFTRNILRTEWNDTIQADKHAKKQLDRRLLLQWEVLQRKDNKLRIKIHDKKRHRQPRIYGEST